MATIISFFNSKGGVGKTLLNNVISYYIKHFNEKRVAVIDLDDPQFTLFDRRKKNIEQMLLDSKDNLNSQEEINSIAELFKVKTIQNATTSITYYEGHSLSYDLFKSTPLLTSDLINLIAPNYDYIFLDIAGTLNIKGVEMALARVNYFILPTSSDMEEIEATLKLTRVILKTLPRLGNFKGYKILFNKVKKVSKNEYDLLYESLSELGYDIFNTYCYEYTTIPREYRNTLFLKIKKDHYNESFFNLLTELNTFIK